jgi:hypothetical protein
MLTKYQLTSALNSAFPESWGEAQEKGTRLQIARLTETGEINLVLRQDGRLYIYRYNKQQRTWEVILKVSFENKYHKPEEYPLHLLDVEGKGKEILVVRTEVGFAFYDYRMEAQQLKQIAQDCLFGDAGEWYKAENVLHFGHFFGKDQPLGLFTRHSRGTVKFYMVAPLLQQTSRDPLWLCEDTNNFIAERTDWHNSGNSFFFADLTLSGKSNVILRNEKGLHVYEFVVIQEGLIERLIPKLLFTTSLCAQSEGWRIGQDRLFFADLTHGPYLDIVTLQQDGLRVYKINQKEFALINYNDAFSEAKGWKLHHTSSLQIENIAGLASLLYSGPKGLGILSFNKNERRWEPVLDTIISPSVRHGTIHQCIPPLGYVDSGTSLLILRNRDNVQFMTLEPQQAKLNSAQPSFSLVRQGKVVAFPNIAIPSKQRIIPQQIPSSLALTTREVWLRDTLDVSSLTTAVDMTTGKLMFSLPLIHVFVKDELTILLPFLYNSNVNTADLLGVGWHLPLNYIRVDDKGHVDPREHDYYWIKQGEPRLLIKKGEDDEAKVLAFQFAGEPQTQILYFLNEERWEVTESSGQTQIYGGIAARTPRGNRSEQNAVGWKIGWEHWRGAGQEIENLIQYAVDWYLTEVKVATSRVLYEYECVEKCIPNGLPYTQAIYLKKIIDNQETVVELWYAEKKAEEYLASPLFDPEGNLASVRFQTRYLSTISLTTSTQQQRIRLDYIFKPKTSERLLKAIWQDKDREPILAFEYEDFKTLSVLKQMTLPRGDTLHFTHKEMSLDFRKFMKPRHLSEAGKKLQVHCGSEYMLITSFSTSDRAPVQLAIRMFTIDGFKECYSALPGTLPRFPLLGCQPIQDYAIHIQPACFAIVLTYTENQEIYLFRRQKISDNWVLEPERRTLSLGTVKFGTNFLVHASNGKLVLFEWEKEKGEWQDISPVPPQGRGVSAVASSMMVATGDNCFVVYDDYGFWRGYRNSQGRWKSHLILEWQGKWQASKNVLIKFELAKETQNYLERTIQANFINLNKNILSFCYLNEIKGQLFSQLTLFLLNKAYKLIDVQDFSIQQDNLFTFSHRFKQNDESYTLAYREEGGQFKVTIKDKEGNILETEEAGKDALKKQFLLNLNNYVPMSAFNVVVCGNQKFIFTGKKWIQASISEAILKQTEVTVKLGTAFVLTKKDKEGTFKLYCQDAKGNAVGACLKDFEVKDTQFIQNYYPFYIAYQKISGKGKNSIEVLPFTNSNTLGIKDSYEVGPGQLTSFSQPSLLVIDHPDTSELTLHPFPHVNPDKALNDPVVIQIEQRAGTTFRRTGYEYDLSSAQLVDGGSVVYGHTLQLPGDDKDTFGWIEEYLSGQSLKTSIFNAKGKKVSPRQGKKDLSPPALSTFSSSRKEQVAVEKAAPTIQVMLVGSEEDSTLFDATGQLDIAQFDNARTAYEEAAYCGFENYEQQMVPVLSQWVFSTKEIITNGWSLTGQNFLRLTGDASLKGTFSPMDQTRAYIGSCWIRRADLVAIGKEFTDFSALIVSGDKQSQQVFAKIYTHLGAWMYAEIYIPLSDIKLKLGEQPLTITISVQAKSSHAVDVDHIRFSPANSRFYAKVYGGFRRQVTALIEDSGSIKRVVYNHDFKPIGVIGLKGQPQELLLVSTYNHLREQKKTLVLRSEVSLRPANGFCEDFCPFSFQTRWQVDAMEPWVIAPGQLRHNGQRHNLVLNSAWCHPDSLGIRAMIWLESDGAELQVTLLHHQITIQRMGKTAYLRAGADQRSVPPQAEWLLMAEGCRLFIWVDGNLLIDAACSTPAKVVDQTSDRGLTMGMTNKIQLEKLFVLHDPQLSVAYYDVWNNKAQEIFLEGTNQATVIQYLYDSLGRLAIATKPTRLVVEGNHPLLAYHVDFVINGDFKDPSSVWETGQLHGLIQTAYPADEGYAYYRIQYDNSPLGNIVAFGQPGPLFAIPPLGKAESMSHVLQWSVHPRNETLDILFPAEDGYTKTAEYKLNGAQHIVVWDKRGNRIALYTRSARGNTNLSTCEYDENGQIVKMLPPFYHEKAATLTQLTPLAKQPLRKDFADISSKWFYDDNGNLIGKQTSDTMKVEFTHNQSRQLRFISFQNIDGQSHIVYRKYDQWNQLIETGFSRELQSSVQLQALADSSADLPGSIWQKQLVYDEGTHPTQRRNLSRVMTVTINEKVIETFSYDLAGQLQVKEITFPDPKERKCNQYPIFYHSPSENIKEITYPALSSEPAFKVIYKYDKQGRINIIGTSEQPSCYGLFEYNAMGQLIKEIYHLGFVHCFTRDYAYNQPGFLTQIEDKFLQEKIYYTEGGYGSRGYFDGTVSRTEFTAKWHNCCDWHMLGLSEEAFVNPALKITPADSLRYIRALKKQGYLDRNNQIIKEYYPAVEFSLPPECEGVIGYYIAKVMGEKSFPGTYGHQYEYGNYMELIKAKYQLAAQAALLSPLHALSFAKEIPGITEDQSQKIWDTLLSRGYISGDCESGFKEYAWGKKGKSFFNTVFNTDFAAYRGYLVQLKKMLCDYFSKRKCLSLEQFQAIFLLWRSVEVDTPTETIKNWQNVAKEIWETLKNKQYFG